MSLVGQENITNFVQSSQLLGELYLLSYPSIITSSAIFMVLMVTVFAPRLAAVKKGFDLRPYLIVYDGLMFGVFGCGFAILMFGIDYARQSWQCEFKSTSIIELWVSLHLTQFYVALRMLENTTPIVKILKGESMTDAMIQCVYNVLSSVILWGAVNAGIVKPYFFMIPACDVFRLAFKYAYYILVTGQGKRKEFLWLKHLIYVMSTLLVLLNYLHFAHMVNSECDFPKTLIAVAIPMLASEWVYLTHRILRKKVKAE